MSTYDPAHRNPLAALIQEHLDDTGESIADVAHRAGLPRQTVSGLLHRDLSGGIPRRSTLEKLAKGLQVSLGTVLAAAGTTAAGFDGQAPDVPNARLAVLLDLARRLKNTELEVLLAAARAMLKSHDA